MTTRAPRHLRYPHHLAVRTICRRFNADPKFQYKLHLIATYMWLVNMVAATATFIFARGFWNSFSIFYVVIVSLYANFATDYGALPSSEAAIHSEAMHKKEEE